MLPKSTDPIFLALTLDQTKELVLSSHRESRKRKRGMSLVQHSAFRGNAHRENVATSSISRMVWPCRSPILSNNLCISDGDLVR